MLDQLGYDITDFWQLLPEHEHVEPILWTRAMRRSWSSSERKIDRCLALFHHDRESTLPTQTLRQSSSASSKLKVLGSSKVVPKYQPELLQWVGRKT